MSELWDVVVIGAGPAGTTAATWMARNGHKVILLDQKSFPREKICGDILISDSLNALGRMGLSTKTENLGNSSSVASVYTPSRIRVDMPVNFITLKRFTLDEMLLKEAVSSGASFAQVAVTHISVMSDRTVVISGNGLEYHAKICFIATGANTDLTKMLGLLESENASAIALRSYVKSRTEIDRMIISFDHGILPGYAWIFPMGNNEYNIGCGVFDGKKDGVNLRETFETFVQTFPVARDIYSQVYESTPLKGARLRCGLTGTKTVGKGNVLVLGEAAGTTYPFTGEGIGKAMESGELAAQVAHKALSSNDYGRLSQYPKLLEVQLKPKFLGYEIAQNWLSYPWVCDLIGDRINRSSFLKDAATGILNETVDPREVFSISGVLRSFIS